MLQQTSRASGKKFIGSDDSFVFMLKPERRKFYASQRNVDHLYCSDKYFSFGSGG